MQYLHADPRFGSFRDRPRSQRQVRPKGTCSSRGSSPVEPRAAPGIRERPSDREEFFAALAFHRLAVKAFELVECVRYRFAGCGNRRLRIAMGAADRLGYDLIDNSKSGEVLGGYFHAGRGLLRFAGV